MNKVREALYRCDSCDDERNCHPALELKEWDDTLICYECFEYHVESGDRWFKLPDFLPALEPAPDLVKAAREVMDLLTTHGGSIVPHLMDSDDNPGERLRQALSNTPHETPMDRIQRLGQECDKVSPPDSPWMPIESAPYDEVILCLRHDGNVVQDFVYDCGNAEMKSLFSHWMHVPPLPHTTAGGRLI